MKTDFFSKFIIVITSVLLILTFAVYYTSCEEEESEYACYGGTYNHCWEANSSSEDDCLAQDRTFSSGSCADNGYTKDCGSYSVLPSGSCY